MTTMLGFPRRFLLNGFAYASAHTRQWRMALEERQVMQGTAVELPVPRNTICELVGGAPAFCAAADPPAPLSSAPVRAERASVRTTDTYTDTAA